jgi:hypothetical protein
VHGLRSVVPRVPSSADVAGAAVAVRYGRIGSFSANGRFAPMMHTDDKASFQQDIYCTAIDPDSYFEFVIRWIVSNVAGANAVLDPVTNQAHRLL